MVAENWLGILISLHNQGDAGHIVSQPRAGRSQGSAVATPAPDHRSDLDRTHSVDRGY